MGSLDNDTKHLLSEWKVNLQYSAKGHLLQSSRLRRRYRLLGIPTTIITTMGGAGTLTGIGIDSPEMTITSGIMGLLAAIISGIQNILNYASDAQQCLTTGRSMIGIIRRIEQVLTMKLKDEAMTTYMIEDIRRDMENVNEDAPGLSNWVYRRARKLVDAGETV